MELHPTNLIEVWYLATIGFRIHIQRKRAEILWTGTIKVQNNVLMESQLNVIVHQQPCSNTYRRGRFFRPTNLLLSLFRLTFRFCFGSHLIKMCNSTHLNSCCLKVVEFSYQSFLLNMFLPGDILLIFLLFSAFAGPVHKGYLQTLQSPF